MAVTNYFSANGRLLGENGPNGRVDYLTDALGSVTTTVNGSGAVLNRYRYKPSGALLSKTGTAPDPKFTWVGSRGYRQTSLAFSDAYVRARHFSSLIGCWSSVDPRWPMQRPYSYVVSNPSTGVDTAGSWTNCTDNQLITCNIFCAGHHCKSTQCTVIPLLGVIACGCWPYSVASESLAAAQHQAWEYLDAKFGWYGGCKLGAVFHGVRTCPPLPFPQQLGTLWTEKYRCELPNNGMRQVRYVAVTISIQCCSCYLYQTSTQPDDENCTWSVG